MTVLVACSGGSGGPPAGDIFTDANVYGAAAPAGAQTVDAATFATRVHSGDAALLSAQADAQARGKSAAQATADRAYLEALPDKSDALRGLLALHLDAPETPDGDVVTTVTGRDGQPLTVLTLGEAVRLRAAVLAHRASQDPANVLSVYTLAYGTLDESLQAQLPGPDALKGRPLADVQAAVKALDALLGADPNLDGVQVRSAGTLANQSVPVTEGGSGSGHGTDAFVDPMHVCGIPDAAGLVARVNWPLERFISPVKNQKNRGTCWAFSDIGAIESREQVVLDHTVNLSEQFFNAVRKSALLTWPYTDGDVPTWALDTLHGQDLAPESAWTYNPAVRRQGDALSDVCEGYDGYCSPTRAETPLICTVSGGRTYCAEERAVYAGPSTVQADHAVDVWVNTFLTSTVPVNVMRGLLAGGHTLIATFGVHPGFDGAQNRTGEPGSVRVPDGYVTDFTDRDRGGHVVLIVGFVPDGALSGLPAVTGGTGGGWFIVKNSWGCAVGDQGFYYVPVTYVQRFFSSVSTLDMSAQRSARWTATLSVLRPPTLTLSVVGGPDVDQNRPFTVQATVRGGSPDCCTIAWARTPLSSTSRSATFLADYADPGPHFLNATLRTALGDTVSASVDFTVVNTRPTVAIVGPQQDVPLPQLPVNSTSSFRAVASDVNEPRGVLPDSGIVWSIARPDGVTETRTGAALTYTWTQLGNYAFTLRGIDSGGLVGTATHGYQVSDTPVPTTTIDVSVLTPRAGQRLPPHDPTTLSTSTPIPPDPKKAGPLSTRWFVTYSVGGAARSADIGKGQTITWTPDTLPDFAGLGAPLDITVHAEVTDVQAGTRGEDALSVTLNPVSP